MSLRFGGVFIYTCLFVQSFAAHAACETPIGHFASLQSTVELQRNDSSEWQNARLSDKLCEGDTIRVGKQSRAAVQLVNDAVLRLDQNTTMRLIRVSEEAKERSLLEVIKGVFQSFSRDPHHLTIQTPYLNGLIEGTEYLVRVDDNQSSILLMEGKIIAENKQGSVTITPGQMAQAKKGEAPKSVLVAKPQDAVQWALHYPALLSVDEKVTTAPGDARAYVNRAASMLSVGRVDNARKDLESALKLSPGDSDALALQAIIEIAQNEQDKALASATQATQAAPDSATALIALSYAQQAKFDLEAARTSLEKAVELDPNNALAWARLAELHSSFLELDKAQAAADKAIAVNPDLSRTQTVLGFVALTRFDVASAKAAFSKAINLDQADPMPHLGLGLAMIAEGNLSGGRGELDVAAILDPNQAIIRSYLGKAYYEEKRNKLAMQQFDIAKGLDPNDPTPWFYEAIAKQTSNQPVDALHGIQQAIDLNDNRAVYRSRMLLDQDHAARGASLARAFNELGFTDQGVAEATNSLTLDPASASAHRFLSDVYQSKRRHEIARVSELLQAQMLQPLNMNPIQPSSTETSLNIVSAGGPAATGFSEFTPLFQRNQIQGVYSHAQGSNETTNTEIALSGLVDNVSFAFGAVDYATDGWRPNNGLEQEVANAFVQYSPTQSFSIQVEHTDRESTAGDLAFNFDPNDFRSDYTDTRNIKNSRVGLRYSFSPRSHLLLSYIESKKNTNLHQVTLLPPLIPGLSTTTSTSDVIRDDESDQAEAQFITKIAKTSLIAGVATTESDVVDNRNISIDDTILGNLLTVNSSEVIKYESSNAYVYANTRLASTIWTYGVSASKYERTGYKDDSVNPKLGIQWDIDSDLKFRAAALQAFTPLLINNRTLEPTQVAGFNQMFDDIAGTKSQRYSMGLDWQAASSFKTGIELTKRDLDEPINDPISGFWISEERDELLHKAYFDWTPHKNVAVHAELVYDEYNSQTGILTADDNLPIKTITRSLPVSVNYFAPSGFYAGIGATYVEQTVQRSATATQASGYDSFTVVDAVLGYRFPKQAGSFSLSAKNLFDKEFNYQDDSYREFRDEPSTGPYFPERMVMARLVINL